MYFNHEEFQKYGAFCSCIEPLRRVSQVQLEHGIEKVCGFFLNMARTLHWQVKSLIFMSVRCPDVFMVTLLLVIHMKKAVFFSFGSNAVNKGLGSTAINPDRSQTS